MARKGHSYRDHLVYLQKFELVLKGALGIFGLRHPAMRYSAIVRLGSRG